MSNIIPFKEPDPKCSFCGTPKSAVKHFFSNGLDKHICGVCLAHATKRAKEHDEATTLHADGDAQ